MYEYQFYKTYVVFPVRE